MKTLTNKSITKAVASLILVFVTTSIFAKNNDNAEIVNTANKSAFENEIVLDADIIELELWMTNPSTWSADRNDFIEIDFEESMRFEGWMTDLSDMSWEIEKESEMELEPWMTQIDNANWNADELADEAQELESWMLNPSNWLTK